MLFRFLQRKDDPVLPHEISWNTITSEDVEQRIVTLFPLHSVSDFSLRPAVRIKNAQLFVSLKKKSNILQHGKLSLHYDGVKPGIVVDS